MSALSKYLQNNLIDHVWRGQAFSPAATLYLGLIVANRGQWGASLTWALGDYIVTGSPSNGLLYKCTTAGAGGSTAPTWNTGEGSTTADNAAVWTEQTLQIKAGTYPECSGAGYARLSIASSLADWAGTQGAGTIVASTGTGGETSNNAKQTFGAPTANWGVVVGTFLADAATAGNLYDYDILTNPKTVNNGDPAPYIDISGRTFSLDP